MERETFGFEEYFQKGLVAAILKDPGFLKQYDDVLIPSYFDYPNLVTITRIAKDLLSRYNSVPEKTTILEEVKSFCVKASLSREDIEGVLSDLHEIYSIELRDKDYVTERVVSFGRRQALRQAMIQAVPFLQKDSADAFEKARSLLEGSLRVGIDSRDLGLTLRESLLQLPEIVSKSSSGAEKKVPTGYPTIDSKTYGGPGRGEVWVIMGFPGAGKSAFLVNLGVGAIKHNLSVFHYTIGDLDEADVLVRYAARILKVPIGFIVHQREEFYQRARAFLNIDRYLRVKYYASGTATMDHVRAHAAKIRAIDGVSPDLIIIDYPEELKSSSDDMYSSGGNHYTAIKAMASEFDSVIWTASQVQRVKVENDFDVITMDKIAESWKKPQKADGICSWNMTYEERINSKARLWVDKTRRAEACYLVHMVVDHTTMSVWESRSS